MAKQARSALKQGAVLPQRQTKGRVWLQCEPHQAHMWAAVIGARVIGRYGNKALALEALASYLIRKQGPKRRYQLGGVLEPKPAGVGTYASSLTRQEYDRCS